MKLTGGRGGDDVSVTEIINAQVQRRRRADDRRG